ncbi:MAG: Hsp20/alpha crystallin family protein [Gallionella sp.]
MANILRYNPADNAFDDLFRGFFMSPVKFEGSQDLRIKLDVNEDDKEYKVHAEIPGVRKDDINVSIEGNQISVSAEVRNEKDLKDGERVLRSERYFGKVSRSFILEHEVDESTAQAKYADGVLELRLPKRASNKAKNLTIQ